MTTIQQLLTDRDLTQADLARLTGVDETYISRIISGDRKVPASFDTYEKVANALGITLEKLLTALRHEQQ